MTGLGALFSNPLLETLVIAPLVLLFLDIVTGVARAVKHQKFSWRRFSDFLGSSFLQYLVAIIATVLVFVVNGSAAAAIVAGVLGMSALATSLAASIVENVSDLNLPPTVEKEADAIVKEVENVATHPPIAPNQYETTQEMTCVRLARINSFLPTERVPAFNQRYWHETDTAQLPTMS